MIRARSASKRALSAAETGLTAVTASRPATKAATAAGPMNRQAETPAARMATSSLRRLRPTKALIPPNRKTKGSRIWMTEGDLSSVRPKRSPALTSARTPIERERSTNCTSRITAVITASAAPTPPSVRARM